jgi:hypothetical protein
MRMPDTPNGETFMLDRTAAARLGIALPELISFFIKSGIFLTLSGGVLYLVLAATYPAVHDTLHNFRHGLAIVPCH